MKKAFFEVLMTRSAERDLEELYNYIAYHDAREKAVHVLDEVMTVIETLSEFPDRGSYPLELLFLGVREFREIWFKPYRVIYRVIEQKVCILVIADGLRDLQSLLNHRVLR